MKRPPTILIFLVSGILATSAVGSPRHEVKRGNQAAGAGNPDQAILHYKRALEQHGDTSVVLFDVGNVFHESGQFDPSFQAYMGSLHAGQTPSEQSETFYNAGNSLFASQKYDSAIAAYVEALKCNPSDGQAKYNLELARRMIRQQQQQQQQNQQDQNDSEQQQQQQQEQQQNQDNEEQKQPPESQPQSDQEQEQQQTQQQAQPQQMTPEEAERLLNALLQNEQEALKEARKMQVATKAKREKDW